MINPGFNQLQALKSTISDSDKNLIKSLIKNFIKNLIINLIKKMIARLHAVVHSSIFSMCLSSFNLKMNNINDYPMSSYSIRSMTSL